MNEISQPLPVVCTDPNERMWAMLCHLGTLVTLFPFANVIVPLTIWVIQKDKSPFVNDQGKEALNFQITIMIAYAVAIALVFVLLGIPLLLALFVYHIVASVIAAMKSNEGRAYRYPFTLRLVT